MRKLRLLIISLAAILVLALAVSALVSGPEPPQDPADDVIIIKGGSLEIQCGKAHKSDNAGCLALDDGVSGKFKHKQDTKKVTRVVVKRDNNTVVFDSNNLNANANLALTDKPEVHITYKATNVNVAK